MDRITLYYHGELKSNGNAKHKHEIREAFRPQLDRAWNQSLLSQSLLASESSHEDFFNREGIKRAGMRFVPWIVEGVVKLNIMLLRPGLLGKIVSSGGDIDNRLKTVFDAMQIPDENQVKAISPESSAPDPFRCLMRDDKIISDVRVKTAQFLSAPETSKEVVLIVDVIRHGSPIYVHRNTAHYLG